MIRYTLNFGAFLLIFSLSWALASNAGPQYSTRTAEPEYAVIEVDLITIQDKTREKDLDLRVYYPDGEGPFPIVIFSHGNTSSKDNYPLVGRFLAERGFVSIHPTHSDSLEYWDQQGDKADWSKQSMWAQERWTSRPRDISFIIDSLIDIGQKCPALRSKLDASQIAVAGHSFGANTAQLIGGARPRLQGEDEQVSFRDSRVKAIVAFSAAGRGWVGMQDDSWDDLRLPMLSVTGTKDFGPEGRHFDFRIEPFLLCPPGDKYQLIIRDMGHNFRSSAEHFELVKVALHSFLDAYLFNSQEARKFLRSGELGTSSGCALLSYR